jgi:hypothetical protein
MPPPGSPEVHFDLGQHAAKIERLQSDMEQMKQDMHEIKTILSEARGGWRAVVIISGLSGVCGAAIIKLAYMIGFIKG